MDRGKRSADRHLRTAGEELREARLAAGASQRVVAAASGMSRAEISRIERGHAPSVPLRRLDTIAAVLGLELSVRLFPVGPPLRDSGQLALLARLRGSLHPGLRWRSEVPIPIPGDLRAWDAAIDGASWTAYVDAETRLRDIQSLQRRVALKQRDSDPGHTIVLVADTRTNRAILRSMSGPLIDEAIAGRDLLRALHAGENPGGNGLILL